MCSIYVFFPECQEVLADTVQSAGSEHSPCSPRAKESRSPTWVACLPCVLYMPTALPFDSPEALVDAQPALQGVESETPLAPVR
jgi:hypothetical protein